MTVGPRTMCYWHQLVLAHSSVSEVMVYPSLNRVKTLQTATMNPALSAAEEVIDNGHMGDGQPTIGHTLHSGAASGLRKFLAKVIISAAALELVQP